MTDISGRCDDAQPTMVFPDDFTWGVSTASYQIEGAAFEDGKGLSVWDVFSHQPGAVWSGHNGDVACDYYHRYEADTAMMRSLGIQAHRFSVCWPRVLPDGVGAVNEKGMAFYDRVVDEMLAAGIEPWVMLFHWDYPYELFKRGGWLNPDSPDWFADYARLMVERLSDRVRHWFAIEEPFCFTMLSHVHGQHAPGLRLSQAQGLQIGHNALLAHGKAVQAMRAAARQDLRIGVVPAGAHYVPASDSAADIEAARVAMFEEAKDGTRCQAWWLDPIYLGHYPERIVAAFGSDMPEIGPNDMDTICQPLDFCAMNYYSSRVVRADADGRAEVLPRKPGYPMTTQADWAIVPEAMHYSPKFLYERYGLPIVITENGHQNHDFVMVDGRVHDPQRVDYITRHLRELALAIADGVPVEGYFHWTIMDNFEWAFGYKIRVGLVYTDFETLERTPKDSAYWYQKIIETNGACLGPAGE
jgi:beta-glucosidase